MKPTPFYETCNKTENTQKKKKNQTSIVHHAAIMFALAKKFQTWRRGGGGGVRGAIMALWPLLAPQYTLPNMKLLQITSCFVKSNQQTYLVICLCVYGITTSLMSTIRIYHFLNKKVFKSNIYSNLFLIITLLMIWKGLSGCIELWMMLCWSLQIYML
ncbi:hypothetical protein HanIR_Chr02g0081801 [Helianthus annuus]|nr:hypothetical protein HanIR_Chr02g0081801 [Helianthus annuus]